MAKGVTSGYAPRGGVLLSPRIWQPFHRDGEQTPIFQHGATYAGHATAVAGLFGGVTLASHLGAETGTDELIEHGFVTRPLRGNSVQISPPFITTDDELRQVVTEIDTVITAQEST